MKQAIKVLFIATVMLVAVAGCSKKEEKKAGEAVSPSGQVTKKEAVVVVPDSVKGKWKAVKIAITDKAVNKETVYTVDIGSSFPIPNSNLSIKVENFLPHFMMEGTTLTSQSNEPKNPAAQVKIMEGGNEIFKGWLFTLYPTTHAFQHPKYGFTLVDFVPAG
ncbi:MAG: hypothetical protein FD174_872 [Geobacteraceae bacterium]|nr:MAG: hypothetical protein FD174_872 [Geobacteraceae bacterium]